MAWPIPTSGEAMVSLKGRVGRGSSRRYARRRTRFVPKAKPNTFWVPWSDDDETHVTDCFRTVQNYTTARRWISIRPDRINFSPRGAGSGWNTEIAYDVAGQAAQQRRRPLRIWRWDGMFELGLSFDDDAKVAMESNPSAVLNHSVLWYMWVMQKRHPQDGNPWDDDGANMAEEETAMRLNPHGSTWTEWLRRRDIRHHGKVDVISYDPVTFFDGVTGSFSYAANVTGILHRNALPLPRIPRGGLVINPGCELNCYVMSAATLSAQVNQLTGLNFVTHAHWPVVGQPQLRMLCSND